MTSRLGGTPASSSLRLLVGTVFVDASEMQRQWFDLQWRFLSKTTRNFDHVTVMSDGSVPLAFSDRSKILPAVVTADSNIAHSNGLGLLLEHFRSRTAEYDYFLFLDSDAFPVRPGWLEFLSQKLEGRYDVAVAIRPENLESRLHASILVAKREALPHLSFEVASAGIDLAGADEVDVVIPAYQSEKRRRAFPLLRSNAVNIHPLLCGLYYDLFYHNGCGSRPVAIRAESYWQHTAASAGDVMRWREHLMDDPDRFISWLRSAPLPAGEVDR
jgi:hypothetical protein